MTRIVFVVLLTLVGLGGIGVEFYRHAYAVQGGEHGHVILYVGLGALSAAVALAGLADDIAADAKPLVELVRGLLPWGRKDPP